MKEILFLGMSQQRTTMFLYQIAILSQELLKMSTQEN